MAGRSEEDEATGAGIEDWIIGQSIEPFAARTKADLTGWCKWECRRNVARGGSIGAGCGDVKGVLGGGRRL